MGHGAGKYEAVELRDGDAVLFKGKGVLKAIDNIHTCLAPAVLGSSRGVADGCGDELH